MFLALTALVLCAADAPLLSPQPTPPSATVMTDKATLMEQHVRTYLNEERVESMGFVAMGAVALGAGVYFLTRPEPFLHGVAYPLMAVALIQLIVGGSVWWRTESQTAQLVGLIHSD